ncbi:uncharacterized protein J3R85_005174 [Psidium guajava]|nr:uncharacterized protein J3R85_005174 [Psidium guajava]
MNTWTSGMDMNVLWCLFGSASLREIAIVAGGCDPRDNILSSAELYNSDIGRWEMLPDMNKARKMCSGLFMDGKFSVIGGTGIGNIKYLICGEVNDMGTRTWRETPNMFPAQNGGVEVNEAPSLLAVVKNELYAADHVVKETRKYGKVRNSWCTLGSLLEHAMS